MILQVEDPNSARKHAERLLSATFADLPAPELQWEQMPPAPVPRLDGASVQIGDIFYVFSGYGSLDYVSVYVFFCFRDLGIAFCNFYN